MALNSADILHAYCAFIPKYKYVICVCPVFPYFFLINSQPRRLTPEAQIMITPKDFPFLDNTSYIDNSTIITIYEKEINKATPLGSVPNHIKAEIVNAVSKSRHLSPKIKATVSQNLLSN